VRRGKQKPRGGSSFPLLLRAGKFKLEPFSLYQPARQGANGPINATRRSWFTHSLCSIPGMKLVRMQSRSDARSVLSTFVSDPTYRISFSLLAFFSLPLFRVACGCKLSRAGEKEGEKRKLKFPRERESWVTSSEAIDGRRVWQTAGPYSLFHTQTIQSRKVPPCLYPSSFLSFSSLLLLFSFLPAI